MAISRDQTVSVIIPVANGERTIAAAVRSALDQDYADTEVIVCVNGSTDGTMEKLRQFDGRILVLSLPYPSAYEARRAGFEASHGGMVLFLDSDDMLAKDAVSRAVETMHDAEAGVVQLHLVQFLRMAGMLTVRFRFPCLNDTQRALDGALYDTKVFNPGMLAKLFRRDILEPFPEIGYDGFWGEDRLFSLHIYTKGPVVAFSPDAVYLYRFGGASRDPDHDRRMEEYRRVHRLKREFAKSHGLASYLPLIDRELETLITNHEAMIHHPSAKHRLKRLLTHFTR